MATLKFLSLCCRLHGVCLALVYYTLLIIAVRLLTLSVSLKPSYGFWPGMGIVVCHGSIHHHTDEKERESTSRECELREILNSSSVYQVVEVYYL